MNRCITIKGWRDETKCATNQMDAKFVGYGNSNYMWSTVIISTFLLAVAQLLTESVSSKPIIESLKENEGFNAYIATTNMSMSMQVRPKLSKFSIVVHSVNDFSCEAISMLASEYFAVHTTEKKQDKLESALNEEEEEETKRVYIKVDSSPSWNLMIDDTDIKAVTYKQFSEKK